MATRKKCGGTTVAVRVLVGVHKNGDVFASIHNSDYGQPPNFCDDDETVQYVVDKLGADSHVELTLRWLEIVLPKPGKVAVTVPSIAVKDIV